MVRCRYCEGEAEFALCAADRLRPESPARYDYFACRDCGALVLEPEPDALVLAAAYPGDYYTQTGARAAIPSAEPEGGRDSSAPAEGRRPRRRVLRAWRARRLLALPVGSLLVRSVSGRRYGRFDWFRRTGIGLEDPVLDVGCGSGRLLFRMQREGFRSLVGIDPMLPAVLEQARGEPRFARETADAHVGEYALVMAHHSFEHARDPRATFSALARRVRPGGWLLLRVPLADCWARRHYGADWAQLDAPRHLHIPTRRAIEELARASDLTLEHVEDDSGVFQIWGSERALPPGGPVRLLRWFVARCAAARLRRAGQGDQAAFYLRRHPLATREG